jgi:hypothetical protein
VDYTVFSGEWEMGRIYEHRGGPEALRWFWPLRAALIVAKPSEQFYTDAIGQQAHPSRIKPPS